ncbi:hypothetical protein ACTFIU_000159 [Dictyostelium citrinum]
MSESANNPNEKTYKINLVKGTKKWNIAKFSNKIDLSSFSKPVRMYKFNPIANMINNESNNFGQPTTSTYTNSHYSYKNIQPTVTSAPNGTNATGSTPNTTTTTTTTTTTAAGTPGAPNPAAATQPFSRKKKYEAKPVNPKTIPWKLEDSEGNNTYQGNVEGNQASSNYFLFMFQSDGSIKAVPCNDWYNFRPKKEFQSLTTEEAEDFMKKKNQEWDVFTSRLQKKTDPSGGSDSSGKKSIEEEEEAELRNRNEDPNRYKTTNEEKKKKKAPSRRREREDQGEGEDGDAPDFESKFDDDDDDTYMDGDGLTGEDENQIEEDEEEEDVDLTEGGLEMKKMIKKQQQQNDSEDDLADDDDKKDNNGGVGDDDEDDDDDEDPDQDDLSNLPKVFGKSNADGTSINSSVKKEDDGGKDSKSSKKSKKKDKDSSPKSKEKKSKKNKSDSSVDTRESKKIKKEPSSPQAAQPNSPSQQQNIDPNDPPFTEEYIKIVLQKSKKVKSLDLINIFKGPLKNPENKQIFLAMVYNVARVVEENGVKYLIPK